MHPFYQWVEIDHRVELPWFRMLFVEFFPPNQRQIISIHLKRTNGILPI